MSDHAEDVELHQSEDAIVISFDTIHKLEIRPEELRLIGRYVSLSHNNKKWVGLVSLITKDTVVLINALTMSIFHFDEVFSKKEETNSKRKGNGGSRGGTPAASSPSAGGTSPSSNVRRQDSNAAAAPESTVVEIPPAAEPSAATPSTTTATVHADPFDIPVPPEVANEVPKLRPYITFNRKDIAGVQFATDHMQLHAQFKPNVTLNHPPMELIRVYIRRFLVHTSQGNNPNKLTMANFVASRSRWLSPEEGLMAQITREEVPKLKEIELAIVEKREKQQAARQARTDANNANNAGGGGGGGGGGRGGHNGRAPRDAEARELLMELGVPSKTTYCAIGHLALSITLLLYAASSLTSADVNMVTPFLDEVIPWVIGAALCLLITGLSTGYHGLNMDFPVRKRWTLGGRTFWLIVCSGLILSAAVGVSIMHFQQKNPVTGSTLESFYLDKHTSDPTAACSFATTFRCSGWDVSCSDDSQQAYCITSCYNTLIVQTVGCQATLEDAISGVVLPTAVMLYLACATLILDWIFYQRFFHFGKLLATAMGVTFTGEPVPAPPPAAAPVAAAPQG